MGAESPDVVLYLSGGVITALGTVIIFVLKSAGKSAINLIVEIKKLREDLDEVRAAIVDVPRLKRGLSIANERISVLEERG